MMWINEETKTPAAQLKSLEMNSTPLNPNAPEFWPSAALPQPYHRSFSIPPPPRSPVAAVRPPLPPPQQLFVDSSGRPRRFRNIHDRREDGGFMMRRGRRFSNNNNFSYRKRISSDINRSKDDVRQKKAPNCLYVEKVRSPAVPVTPGGHETTVMIRNIPNEFTRRRLIKFLDEFCSRVNSNKKNKVDDDDACGGDEEAVAFDFVYLPIDFRTKLNKGYAFVNLTTPKGVWSMEEENLKNQTWGYGDSVRKRREIAVAKIQGKNALIEHFKQTRFECESDEYLPICFSPPRDGSKKKQVAQRNIGHRCQPKSHRRPYFHY